MNSSTRIVPANPGYTVDDIPVIAWAISPDLSAEAFDAGTEWRVVPITLPSEFKPRITSSGVKYKA